VSVKLPMASMSFLWHVRFLWAAPATVIGLALVGVGLLTGASKPDAVDGAIEQSGGLLARILRLMGSACITFGYVTLGRSPQDLNYYRRHERVHTRQYGTWGVFFFPAYLFASLIALIQGRSAWSGNWFEQEAIRESGV